MILNPETPAPPEVGMTVRHREFHVTGEITKVEQFVTIKLSNGRFVKVNKIIIWETYDAV